MLTFKNKHNLQEKVNAIQNSYPDINNHIAGRTSSACLEDTMLFTESSDSEPIRQLKRKSKIIY